MNEPSEDEEWVKAVKTGWTLLAFGICMVGGFIGWPLWQAKHHAPEINLSGEASTIGIILVVIGILHVLAPKSALTMTKMDPKNLKAKDIFYLGACALLAFGMIYWNETYFASLGYH